MSNTENKKNKKENIEFTVFKTYLFLILKAISYFLFCIVKRAALYVLVCVPVLAFFWSSFIKETGLPNVNTTALITIGVIILAFLALKPNFYSEYQKNFNRCYKSSEKNKNGKPIYFDCHVAEKKIMAFFSYASIISWIISILIIILTVLFFNRWTKATFGIGIFRYYKMFSLADIILGTIPLIIALAVLTKLITSIGNEIEMNSVHGFAGVVPLRSLNQAEANTTSQRNFTFDQTQNNQRSNNSYPNRQGNNYNGNNQNRNSNNINNYNGNYQNRNNNRNNNYNSSNQNRNYSNNNNYNGNNQNRNRSNNYNQNKINRKNNNMRHKAAFKRIFNKGEFVNKGYNKQGIDRSGKNQAFYVGEVKEMEELLLKAKRQMKTPENYAYALHDIRIILEKGTKCILSHWETSDFSTNMCDNINTCSACNLLSYSMVENLHKARIHCNGLQHDTGETKVWNDLYFCYTTAEEFIEAVKASVIKK